MLDWNTKNTHTHTAKPEGEIQQIIAYQSRLTPVESSGNLVKPEIDAVWAKQLWYLPPLKKTQ